MNLPEALMLICSVIHFFLAMKVMKRIRQIEKANRAYRDALWEIRFCDEEYLTLKHQVMEAIALKALTENETEWYAVTLTKNKEGGAK